MTDGDCGYHEDWPLAYCKCCRDEATAQAKAEGAAEERTRHQAYCERALLEMEESATRREREACAWLVRSLSYAELNYSPNLGDDIAAAIEARGGKSCGRDSCFQLWHTKKCWAARGGKP